MGYSRHPANQGARDANSAEIVAALRKAGASVTDLGPVGGGVPDLLVGYLGATFLIEAKSATTHARRAKDPALEHGEYLTDDQIEFLSKWRGGRVHIVTSSEEALAVLGLSDEVKASIAAKGE